MSAVEVSLEFRLSFESLPCKIAWRLNASQATTLTRDGQAIHFGHTGTVKWAQGSIPMPQSAAWACDGRYLAIAGPYHDLQILDYSGTLRQTAKIDGPYSDVRALTTGNLIATRSWQGGAGIHRVNRITGEVDHLWRCPGRIEHIRWLQRPTPQLLLVSEDGRLSLCNARRREVVSIGKTESRVDAACWLSSELLAISGAGPCIEIWNIQTGSRESRLEGHQNPIWSLSLSPCQKFLASKSLDNTIKLWRVSDLSLVASIDESSNAQAHEVCFHPRYPIFASIDADTNAINVRRIRVLDEPQPSPMNGGARRSGRRLPAYQRYSAKRIIVIGESSDGRNLAAVLAGEEKSAGQGRRRCTGYYLRRRIADGDGFSAQIQDVWFFPAHARNGDVWLDAKLLSEADMAVLVIHEAGERAQRLIHRISDVAKHLVGPRLAQGRLKLWLAHPQPESQGATSLKLAARASGFERSIKIHPCLKSGIHDLRKAILQTLEERPSETVHTPQALLRMRSAVIDRGRHSLLPSYDELINTLCTDQGSTSGPGALKRRLFASIASLERSGHVLNIAFAQRVLLDRRYFEAHRQGMVRAAQRSERPGWLLESQAESGNFLVAEQFHIHDDQSRRIVCIAAIESLIRERFAIREPGTEGDVLLFPDTVPTLASAGEDDLEPIVQFRLSNPPDRMFGAIVAQLCYDTSLRRVDDGGWASFRNEFGSIFRITAEQTKDRHKAIWVSCALNVPCFEIAEATEIIRAAIHMLSRPDSVLTTGSFRCPQCNAQRSADQHRRPTSCEDCRPIGPQQPAHSSSKSPQERIVEQDSGLKNSEGETIRRGKAALGVYDVFVSYSSKDRGWVSEWLIPRLQARGIRVCWDYGNFEIGGALFHSIAQGITQSRKTIFVLSKNWSNSEWTDLEMQLTKGKDIAGKRRRALPLVLDDHPVPDALTPLVHADFRDERYWESELERLVTAILSDPAG